MGRQAAFALALGCCITATAAPPGAIRLQPVSVPPSMQTDVFASPQSVYLPPGFQMAVWARVPGARFLAVAANGDVFVSQPSLGQITILRPDPNGGDPASFTWASGLRGPQGLAFNTVNGTTWLYVGETNQIDRYIYNAGDTAAPAMRQVLITNLSDGDAHPYKDIAIGPDNSVYFGFGSSCNVCVTDTEQNPEPASVFRMNPDGTGLQLFALGLRNPEGLAFVPGSNTLWAAVNNRDDIPYPYNDSTGNYQKIVTSYVDDHPPDLFTSLRQGGNYGWPFCNSTEDAPSGYDYPPFDNDQDTNSDGHVNCGAMDRVTKGVQAHSAPLGLAFLQQTSFAAPYRNGAVIAYHGSWDRSVPTGYKVVFFPWNTTAQTPADPVDLITGFYNFGRPVGVAVNGDGALLITDDTTGTVYKLSWAPSALSAANGYSIIAPDSYAAVYGNALAGGTASAVQPYPSTLGGVSLSLSDSAGQTFTAPLVYVSPSQINFIVPHGMAAGAARLTLIAGNSSVDLGSPEIQPTAPGLFSLSGDGNGVAAATAADAQGNPVQVFSCDGSGCSATPIAVNGNTVYLSLYGTGFRNAASGSVSALINGVSVPVQYAGAQPTYTGLDQVNIALPASLAGADEVQITLWMSSDQISNPVTIRIQ
ncbi:MAG TPA: hypothetical protein VG297_08870 [Bryobacteraceae bacterium]|nr:hypothetical protein [Bryobacteraceae bacterium]